MSTLNRFNNPPTPTSSSDVIRQTLAYIELAEFLCTPEKEILARIKEVLGSCRKIEQRIKWEEIINILDLAGKYKWDVVNDRLSVGRKSCQKRIREAKEKILNYVEKASPASSRRTTMAHSITDSTRFLGINNASWPWPG
jgi:hypothetical protein